jgi:hypothetical protein
VNWTSPVTADRIHKYSHEKRELAVGDRIRFDRTEFGIPGNLAFSFEVYAPGITELYALNGEEKRSAIAAMGVTVESPFYAAGGVRTPSHRGQSGVGQHNWRFSFELADPDNFSHGTPPPGDYPFTVNVGDRVVAQFTLEWR